jgi:hypothetical protein
MAPACSCADKAQQGYILVTVMLLMLVLTVIGVAATSTSRVEIDIAGNERRVNVEFFQADGAINAALENLKNNWLTIPFLVDNPQTANYSGVVDIDGDNVNDASVEVRYIEDTGISPVAGLSENANDLPLRPHVDTPSPNTMSDWDSFIIRRFGVTATSINRGAVIQVGVEKSFPKNAN